MHAQTFDATALTKPAEIGTMGVVHAGDDPAWSRADFDDSKWQPVDSRSRLRDYFPTQHAPVLWRRLRIKVSPQQHPELGLQTYSLSRAYEIYVNGQKLIQSGQVEPFVAYTRTARSIIPIPEDQLRTGTLSIAIRESAPRTYWTSNAPAFNAPMLAIGEISALRNGRTLANIAENAAGIFENLLGMGVGIVALALFLGQRQRMEYFWIFTIGLINAATMAFAITMAVRNVPVSFWALFECLQFALYISILLMLQGFSRRSFGYLFWVSSVAISFFFPLIDLLYVYGIPPAPYYPALLIPISTLFGVVVPILLFRQMRRGDREAGILLIPFFFFSLYLYSSVIFGLASIIPALTGISVRILQRINSMPIGIVNLGIADVGLITFYLSLAIIIVLRSTRITRQQAVLEGEMAAAQQVQQIILPEQVETIPEFAIESVYHPAQQVGGDFFQVLPCDAGGLFLVIGDVAGKGLPAAMLVSVLVGAARTAAAYSQSPSEVLAQLNDRLVGRTLGGFSTALAAHISPEGLVTIANAGHLSPYLDGREIELPGAVPLGLLPGNSYESIQFNLPRGSRLTFYSDGVVEAQKPTGELFGFHRASEISTHKAAVIAEAARIFGQADDITVLTVERLLAHQEAPELTTVPVLMPA
jgi:hypothetical protein